MKFEDLDISLFVSIYNDHQKYCTLSDVAERLGVSTRSVRRWAEKLEKQGCEIKRRVSNPVKTLDAAKKIKQNQLQTMTRQLELARERIKELQEGPRLTFDERLEVKKFKQEISFLKKELKKAEDEALTSKGLRQLIHGAKEYEFSRPAKWLSRKGKARKKSVTPTLFLSDLHFDEYVDPAQVNYVNEFNREIAEKRIQHTFNKAEDILFNKLSDFSYDGLVLALGGDMLSGNIHEELVETNEDHILRSLIVLADNLIYGIERLRKRFENIFIPCVVGNHSRLHKKPRAKGKIYDNFEWLLYNLMARHFKNDAGVTFLIPDGPDAIFKIYDKTFLLTHGDQFRGGNAIAGIFSPLMLGFHKKQKKQASVNNHFDVMLVGHFHQYVHTEQLIINGSLKGMDEYANNMNFPYEPPQQALWINHPEHGMVFRTPILCDSYK